MLDVVFIRSICLGRCSLLIIRCLRLDSIYSHVAFNLLLIEHVVESAAPRTSCLPLSIASCDVAQHIFVYSFLLLTHRHAVLLA